ncbi:MAG: SMP-30/gluconolactonase/LRE family protein [Proteobacteria bacterium]|nr:SMP-30/gluconolactonase/LRE family protein [Pseudomonadota bacterium]
MTDLSDIIESSDIRRVATGYAFTEGPLWHPDGFFYFNDIRPGALYRVKPGEEPVLIRRTNNGNGMTFDLQGRLIQCEGEGKRVTRSLGEAEPETLVDRFEGGRLNRPNDAICHSNGDLYFTDPGMSVPFADREQHTSENKIILWAGSRVYRITPDGAMTPIVTCEYPNGLAFSPDERVLYVANTGSTKYIHAIDLDSSGNMARRRIFADLSEGDEPGFPDGMKVDALGRVYCTGPGGIWVLAPDGTKIGVIKFPEQAINMAFGGDDLRTMLVTAHTSVFTMRMKTPGMAHPWYALR